MDQYQLPFIVALLEIAFFPAPIISCQVHPSGYAYHDDSVTRAEEIAGVCRKPGSEEHYVLCDGIRLKLSDNNLGQEQYQESEYYRWSDGRAEQLLFIFPTLSRDSLMAITLHYYSDRERGRPRLRFYAVPDHFDVWDAPTSDNPYVGIDSVPPDGESRGRRSVSINVNFNTMKVLMYKFSSSFTFAVSEVEFFTCTLTSTATPNETISSVSPLVTYMTATSTSDSATGITANNTSTKQDTTTAIILFQKDSPSTSLTVAGIVGALLLIVITSLITILSLILWRHKRRAHKSEIDPNSAGSMREDASYSILERGRRQQIQPQDSNSTELYDQIHLSPSTGQTELISKTESETARDISVPQSNIYSDVDMENLPKSKPISSCEPEKSTLEDATYAVVNKKKNKKKSKGASHDNANKKEKIEEEVKVQEQPSLDDMYAVVQKKPKKREEQGETPPPVPASTVESLYTAVQKTPQ